MSTPQLALNLGWLYPDLMSIYRDRGNIIILSKRAQWRTIQIEVKKISLENDPDDIKECDLLFMGGAQDKQQEIDNSLEIKAKEVMFKRYKLKNS